MLHLRVISGPSKGRTVALDESHLPLTIGRDPENKIALDHNAVSRFHCVISTAKDAYFVEDLESTNGTYLNGRRIRKEYLSPGDEVIIANVGIVIEASPSSIYQSHAPLDVNVSIDIKSPKDNSLTLTNPTETMGVRDFLAGFASEIDSKSFRALQILYKADHAFRDIEDLKQLMENLLDLIMDNFPSSRGYVFLIQRDTGNLVPYVRRPVEEADEDAEIVVSQTILQTAVKQKSSIVSSDALVDERFMHSRSVAQLTVRSAMCVPLINRGRVLGIVYLDSTSEANVFSREDLALFSAVALKAGIAIDNARLYDDLRGLFYNTVETLVRTIQAKDQYTAGHSTRVSRLALLTADRLGLTTKEKHQLYLASMLHDIGKIGVPDDLLNRPGKLSEEEMDRVRHHVQLGASMIEMLGEMHPIVPLIRHHHEAFDGSGYPDGLKGEEIPLTSRIIAVADMYDAITSDRPYRGRRSYEEAVEEIKRSIGTKLDPRVGEAFLQVIKEIAPADVETTAILST